MFKKKKNGPFHQLTVGLRTQLCKECENTQTRLCEADGKPATFHRWVDEDAVHFSDGAPFGIVRRTGALVEYLDGSVGIVRPELVTFLDKEV